MRPPDLEIVGSGRATDADLDKKDRLILEALQANARQSLAALGKRIGLSQPAVSERVKKSSKRPV